MPRLNLSDVTIAYGAGTVASITTGFVTGWLWEHWGGHTDYTTTIGLTWLAVVGIPSCLVAADTIKEKLGQRPGNYVASSRALSRVIPVNHAQGSTNVFMSLIGWSDDQKRDMADSYTVSIAGSAFTLTEVEIEDFLAGAWRRQRAGHPGLSRQYWTSQHRPRLRRLEYQARLELISSVQGLVLDREERRSGRLALPPKLALQAIKTAL